MKKMILVTSPPACGKTYISKQLAKELKHVVYLDKDTVIPLSNRVFKAGGQEIKSAKRILKTLGLRKGGIEVVSCPTCGRTQIDLIGLANQVETLVQGYDLDIKVAVMGCVVNGPGEAKEADLGVAGGKGVGILIKKGEIVKKVPESELLSVLKDELDHWGK